MRIPDMISNQIRDYARDVRLNLETILSPEGAPGLSPEQITGAALACAYALGSKDLAIAIEEDHAIGDAVREAAKSAAVIMAMNNVYYRSIHLAEDKELGRLPARLRMNVIGKPGIPRLDFEIMCLAVSAIAGCGMCIHSHSAELRKAGIELVGVQSAIRIGAVMQSVASALRIG